jgi:uncharacterized membrane protein YciS (DUF1049 family)
MRTLLIVGIILTVTLVGIFWVEVRRDRRHH